MFTQEQGLYIAHGPNGPISIIGKMANRHGLIAGATGTGKTVSLQVMAESFCQAGVPCFMADMKGDLSGISQAGQMSGFIEKRLPEFGLDAPQFQSCPVRFYDVYGEQGHPMRTTVSQMGPDLLARLFELNETQAGVLTIAFHIADDNGWLLDDLKDLRSLLDYVSKHAKEYTTQYGTVASATVGAIQRAILRLEDQGGNQFFGKPSFDIMDLLQCDGGKGVMSVLAADKLMMRPKLYSTFLLWLMSELYSTLPEVGDMERPKLIFFFDEAHMLFEDTSKAMVDKIEQVVRLIRSKGVGIYFVTQSPTDIPVNILGQLGNRVQHALRAYTPKDQKAVKTAADTFRPNPDFKTDEAIMNLEDRIRLSGTRQDGWYVDSAAQAMAQGKILFAGKYDKAEDRESAFEVIMKLKEEEEGELAKAAEEKEKEKEKAKNGKKQSIFGKVIKAIITAITGAIATIIGTKVSDAVTGKKTKSNTSVTGKIAKNATSAATRTVTRELTRDILGNLIK